jgi:hypothetical protein
MRLRPANLRFPNSDLQIARRNRAQSGYISSSVTRHSLRASGVALVVTIVLLSVITFLAVVFLALTGRETGSVKTSINQTLARQAAEAGFERAKAELIARILATTNVADFGLLVSTNFINWDGFNSGAVDQRTNVNYDYRQGGGALGFNDRLLNLANLYYSPRPPVFVTNRLVANSIEFRFYHDLNRNGRYDATGYWPVRNPNNGYYDTNGNLISDIIIGNTLSNFVKGDPEWIGGTDRPNLPHGPENPFLYRYAYISVPIGKTLDVNYIHNNAKPGNIVNGFLRNQGVGSWEINFAAFLADLNTNLWNSTTFSLYDYPLNVGLPNLGLGGVGAAFDDAYNFWLWRRAGGAQSSVQNLYGGNGANAFRTDFVDGYSSGNSGAGNSILAQTSGYGVDPDNAPVDRTTAPWAGADLPNHYFTTQDLLDPSKTSTFFVNRLIASGTNVSTYDNNTYYRMLEQLGTSSAPEDPDKINLNYVNIPPLAATNFVRWEDTNYTFAATYGVPGSVLFFTNVVDRLLRAHTTEWLLNDVMLTPTNSAYVETFQVEAPFGVGNIPVLVSNKFVYNSAVHRVLQVAANLWEAKNLTTGNRYPTVFRPVFSNYNNHVFIRDFVEVTGPAPLSPGGPFMPLLDVGVATNAAASIIQANNGNVLIYGVPLVIGARKGLPNFNEFQIAPKFTMTRKVQLVKPTATSITVDETNQFFTMSIVMPSAAEFWNAYMTNFTMPVTVCITNRTSILLTNDMDVAVKHVVTLITGDRYTTNFWPRFNPNNPTATANNYSFFAMMRTNVPFLPVVGSNVVYIANQGPSQGFFPSTNNNRFDVSQALLMPRWGMVISNRVHAMILEQGTDRIIDYVLLGNLVCHTNLTDVFSRPTTWSGGLGGNSDDAFKQTFEGVWATNVFPVNPAQLTGRRGVEQQINISLGMLGKKGELNPYWKSYSRDTPNDVAAAIADFQTFFTASATTNQTTVPFSPSVEFSIPMIWQANDPLVHYMAEDLFYTEGADADPVKWHVPPQSANYTPLDNIGKLNDRYHPWGWGAQTEWHYRQPAVKDPGVRSANIWEFPTNTLPSIGWLGRFHRGTPWQSVYMKAADLKANATYSLPAWLQENSGDGSAAQWRNFGGNRDAIQGYYMRPVMDRLLFNVFTTAINENAARGRLPINQSGLAAWSAVFSGVVALTNVSGFPQYNPIVIQPAGVYDPFDVTTWPPLVRLVEGINRTRMGTNSIGQPVFPGAAFQNLGDILAVPELTDASPYLNLDSSGNPFRNGLTDAAYEWLPQQVMGLLQLGQPRFVVYSYGQALQPAPDSIVVGGSYDGLCTNYTITAEVAARAVVRVEGSPNPAHANTNLPAAKRYPPRVVVESYNLLGPE